jgi:ribosomal protein S18 acetylase RimI-like enzyme
VSSKSATKPQDSEPPSGGRVAVPTSNYTYEQLADIYNQARVDYIVPMPMNAKRMREYVEAYDVSLDGSVVVLNDSGLESGVGMLGLRGERSWITRLGVIPERRERHLGLFTMETMLDYAKTDGCTLSQLEVIVGNDPARRLFERLGFEETRTLLIIRRPPGVPKVIDRYEQAEVKEIESADVPAYLAKREDGASWIEETASLLNVGNIRGVAVKTADNEIAWVIFQRTPFQLTHFVLSPNVSDDAIHTALYHVHKTYPMQDTKIENVPLRDHQWEIYKSMGYIEVFRRTEMFLYF